MQPEKKSFLASVRMNTAYATYRNTIGAIARTMVAVAVINLLIGMFAAITGGYFGLMFGLLAAIAGLVVIIITRFLKEQSLMLADIADTLAFQVQRDQTDKVATSIPDRAGELIGS